MITASGGLVILRDTSTWSFFFREDFLGCLFHISGMQIEVAFLPIAMAI